MRMGARPLVLASTSERRVYLLRSLGLHFKVIPPKVEEQKSVMASPEETAMRNASLKSRSVMRYVKRGIVIGADTVVVVNGKVLGKPINIKDARNMLEKLGGKWHDVVTGLSVLLVPEGTELRDWSRTSVKFKELSRKEIDFYLSTGEPLGKAGAYAIQGRASLFVEEIRGCYFNVVGLPLNKLYVLMMRAGIDLTRYMTRRG